MVDVILCGRPFAQLETLAEAFHPKRVRRTASPVEALRLCGVDEVEDREDLAALPVRAAEIRADHFIVPEGFSVKSFKLATFDMDSTLTRNECIDDMAALVGKGEEVARITREAMEGKLPFAENLRRRVAILEGFPKALLDKVNAETRLQAGAEAWIAFLQKHGVRCAIVTGGFTDSAAALGKRLGIDLWISNTLEWTDEALMTGRVFGPAGGRVLDADGKRRALEVLASAAHLSLAQTIAAGDGANDLEMIGAAGFGFAFHGKPVVEAAAPHAVRFGGLDVAMLAFVEAWS